ncbi:MAG: hypothetical protein NUV96_00770 [Candidatus Colwellbacteria bacterium]|nr:hypothetical protein [Candidatus Colwellbacteria bacterium]
MSVEKNLAEDVELKDVPVVEEEEEVVEEPEEADEQPAPEAPEIDVPETLKVGG